MSDKINTIYIRHIRKEDDQYVWSIFYNNEEFSGGEGVEYRDMIKQTTRDALTEKLGIDMSETEVIIEE